MTDIDRTDAVGLAALVRRREVSSLELVDRAISRIERANPALNAVVTPMFEEARRAARQPMDDGPFAGVPYLLKDGLAACAGVRMTNGSRLCADFVPGHDSVLVSRLRRAGFLFVGKTNLPEFGLLPTTDPLLHGPTRNPWDLARTPGGSSGGSAAAVAARLVPAAHANDGGGSIRIPAACCGVFGLKPTRGRISLGPDLGDIMGGLVVEHAVTISVRDSAAILDATHGPAPGDPYSAPPPARPFSAEVGASPGRLRIGFTCKTLAGTAPHPDVVRAVEVAATLCEDLGHDVFEWEPALSGDLLMQAFLVVWTAGAAAALDGFALTTGRAATPESVEPLTLALAAAGRGHAAPSYLIATGMLQRLAREAVRSRSQVDVYLTPVLAEPPVPLGTFDPPGDDPLAALTRASEFAAFTPVQNVTGEPAMSVPLSWNDSGLPIGVQFVGRYGDEATLFRPAAQLEDGSPWAGRVPAAAACDGGKS